MNISAVTQEGSHGAEPHGAGASTQEGASVTDHVCKCCGQTLPEPFEVGTLKSAARDLVHNVWKSGQHGIDAQRLLSLVYADDPDGGPLCAETTLRVRIHYINKKHLKPAGYRIIGEHTGAARPSAAIGLSSKR
jgi:hypothetical protein